MMSFVKKLVNLNRAPIVRISYSYMDVVAEAVALLALLFSLLTLWLNWSSLSGSIPTHFNYAGNSVQMGSKSRTT